MKKILIIVNAVIYSLIIFACQTIPKKMQEEKIDFYKDKRNFVIIDRQKFLKQEISTLIAKAYLLKTKTYYDNKNANHQTYVDMLYFGTEYFNIDYKEIISIITIESEWNPLAYGKNKNGSEDFGLAQINSTHINTNYLLAKKILNQYKIKYTNSNYDIKLNILSAYIHLNDIKDEIRQQNKYSYKRMIVSYNVGVAGSLMRDKKESIAKYWNKFRLIRKEI